MTRVESIYYSVFSRRDIVQEAALGSQLSLALDEYVVFDFETTGLSAWGGDEVIEIGAMRILGDEIDEGNVFHTLVNPRRLIPEEATRVHGITNEMVASAPTLEEVFPRFLEFIGDSWLVAQNAKFDMSFVTKYLMQFRLRKNLEVFDTIQFSRRVFPSEQRHNLDLIASRLGLTIAPEDRHRSLGDVKLTAKAFLLMKDRLGDNVPPPERWTV